jgi:hypothetical protein
MRTYTDVCGRILAACTGAAYTGAAAAAWLEREQREADDKAREAAADALARQQREAELEEARRKREAAAQVASGPLAARG